MLFNVRSEATFSIHPSVLEIWLKICLFLRILTFPMLNLPVWSIYYICTEDSVSFLVQDK